jgi:hypothetical protein
MKLAFDWEKSDFGHIACVRYSFENPEISAAIVQLHYDGKYKWEAWSDITTDSQGSNGLCDTVEEAKGLADQNLIRYSWKLVPINMKTMR